MEKERSVNPYREFKEGQTLDFNLITILPHCERLTPKTIVIDKVKSGGFFGKVLIPKNEDYIIKTSLPDPLKHLARTLYWGLRQFPTQHNETSAKLEHIATRLIHKVLPTLTNGRFYAPDSLGYTKLLTGYAQVLEKMEGRPPRFDLPENEIKLFQDSQKELTKLALELGFEHAGQIHPDNPFGLANLWFDQKRGVFVWLDTIPAMQHRGPFKFHREIRKEFKEDKPTFNKIHTDRFSETLRRYRYLFSYEEYKDIEDNLELYRRLSTEDKTTKRTPSDAFNASYELMADAGDFFLHLPKKTVSAAVSPVRVIFNKDYRDNVTISGVKKAQEQGIIGQREMDEAIDLIKETEKDPVRKLIMITLYGYYFTVGRTSDLIAASIVYNGYQSDDFFMGLIKAFAFDTLYPALMRRVGTMAIGGITRTELSTAANVASVPWIPGSAYSAVPAQIAISSAKKSELIWHYRVREQIANLTGYGTQLEATVWNKVGKRLESIGKRPKTS